MASTNEIKKAWRMSTWSNGDGTGTRTERRYTTRATAVRAADRLRARGVVAYVEHDGAEPPVTHWRD